MGLGRWRKYWAKRTQESNEVDGVDLGLALTKKKCKLTYRAGYHRAKTLKNRRKEAERYSHSCPALLFRETTEAVAPVVSFSISS